MAKAAAVKKGGPSVLYDVQPVIETKVSGKNTMRPGKGSPRKRTRLIVLYGPPKSRKTTAASTIKGAKWIVSDPNCVPTLDALDRLPEDDDLYEVKDLLQATATVNEMVEAAADGGLPVPAVITDSLTQFSDWHQQDVARATGQKFMGDNKKDAGWQQFNGQFGEFIDALGSLSNYVTVIAIAHAKEKVDGTRGEWAGLNLPPQMALKAARTANWVLYQSIRTWSPGEESPAVSNEFVSVVETPLGLRATEVILHTQTIGNWVSSVNARNLRPEEPANLGLLLQKEGLL